LQTHLPGSCHFTIALKVLKANALKTLVLKANALKTLVLKTFSFKKTLVLNAGNIKS